MSPRFLASHRLQAGSVVRAAAAMLLFSAPLSAQTRPGPAVTFTKDVAPILQRSCVTCHRPGQSAPMSLQTFEEARAAVA